MRPLLLPVGRVGCAMRGSFKVATIAGTEVRIHLTFLILLVFVALHGLSRGGGAAGALDAVLFISAMFLCVLLHEFGHVFAARGYGIRTPDITLLPIGGVARLERMPRTPAHELVVAVCGPLVNVGIAALIFLGLGLHPDLDPANFRFEQPGHFWEKLLLWNLLMVAFNLVPAFPMDGGRVLRALLAMVVDYGRATRWAATIGQGIALSVVLWMLLGGIPFQPILLLIAFFIFMAAGQEAAAVAETEATRGLRVRDAMMTEFQVLPADAVLGDAVERLLAGSQHDFPVMDGGGELLGLLSRQRLIEGLARHGSLHRVADLAEDCPEPVEPAARLAEALERLRATPCPMLPVFDPSTGRLVGLLTAENVAEVLMVRAALGR